MMLTLREKRGETAEGSQKRRQQEDAGRSEDVDQDEEKTTN